MKKYFVCPPSANLLLRISIWLVLTTVFSIHADPKNASQQTSNTKHTLCSKAQDAFIQAVKFNSPSRVEELLAHGENPNACDAKDTPMLVLAFYEDAFDVASLLIRQPNIDFEQSNRHQETALMMAALKGQLAIVKDIVQRGAEIDRPGWSALHYAASNGHLDVVRYLIEQGAQVDARSPNHTTPLMMAARGGYIHITKLLLDADVDIFLKNDLDLTAADFAEQYQKKEIAQGLRSRMRKLQAIKNRS